MDFNFSSSTSLYFYSALLQGNAALIALVAVFLIYRKQYLDSSFDKIEKMLVNYLAKKVNVVLNYGSIFYFEVYSEAQWLGVDESAKESAKSVMTHNSWASRFGELKYIEKTRKDLWNNASGSIVSIFSILIASVFMLPLSDLVHSFFWVESTSFLLFVIVEILTLVALFRFIKGQLKS